MKHTIGNRLKEIRREHKLLQSEVAAKINVSRQTYSHYETGRICPPTETIAALANFYHVSVDELISPPQRSPHAHPILTEEVKLMFLYRSMSDAQRKALFHYAQFISTQKMQSES